MTDDNTMRVKVRTSAPLKEVAHALTDAAELRVWLAEHAEVDLPRRYAFWGRHTPDGAEPRQRPLHVDERAVRFAWTLDGVETTVEFTLADEDGGTVVALSQSDMVPWGDALAERGVRSVLHTFWALSLANLVDHVEGRPLTPKVDFTSPQMRAEVLIDASRDKVYASLVEAEQFERWFGAKVGIEAHVGGRFAMGGFDLEPNPARVVALEPGRSMSIAWGDAFVSTWELEDSGGKTRLTFVQSGFDPQHPPYGGWAGWLGGVAELRRYHELPGWRPTWVALDTPGVSEEMLTIPKG
ncbi:SRPBCC domain-containing protein [Dactylosporangium sp. NPDC048998]|uniref:SRPBCC domain-containing protein n=1 Tax=Dactylosporangium sp. NPDC048998 TaxID=3363976 RepID=UPI003713B188